MKLAIPKFQSQLKRCMKKLGNSDIIFEMEITEHIFLNDSKLAIKNIQKIKNMGIHISIDDFGTEYSSLHYLSSLPVNTLKIDKKFTDKITEVKGFNIIKSIIQLANLLKLDVIVEGIETSEQTLALQKIQNTKLDISIRGQGFYFYKPMSSIKLIQTISSNLN